ncbi:DinB family protein [Granulicoccus sp. GXG6511]|uniref:DinB family protein n=1 Tax=Granulicoccus sp. GXG6511 TaxID=3381351 RepID=UPI003D7E91D3
MFPAILTESQTLTGYIDEMLQGIRNSAHGLTDEQARSRPTRSTLSIAGLIKHTTWVMGQTVPRVEGDGQTADPDSADGAAEFYGSFTPTGSETLNGLLTAFDATRERYRAAITAMDPAAEIEVGPQPWDDQPNTEIASQRLLLAHHIDEFARHAGHADIIREQLDGATAMALKFAVEGRPGNAFVQPWSPDSTH